MKRVATAVGQGANSNVFCAETETHGKVAIKRLKEASEAERERAILKELIHENIISLVGEQKEGELILEWMQHDLRGLMRSPHSVDFSRAQVKGYAHQLVSGVAYCHSRGYMHLDLKPENILLSAKGVLKITDFGLAERHDPTVVYDNPVVTLWYRPLEVCYHTRHFDYSIDMWSVGCIIGELLLNYVLLPGESEAQQPECIYALCGTPVENGWPEAVHLSHYIAPSVMRPRNIDGALRVNNKSKRAGFFTKGALDLLDRLLALKPEARLSAADALSHSYFVEESPKPLQPFLMPRYEISYFGSIRKK